MENASAPDDEFSESLEPILAAMRHAPPLAETDWRARRTAVERAFSRLCRNVEQVDSVSRVEHPLTAGAGRTGYVHVYEPVGREAAATLVYVHGGGRFSCTVATYDRVLRLYADFGIRVVAVDYALPPETPLASAIDDVVRAVAWAYDRFGRARLVLGGDSGGAGLAFSTAMVLRDRGSHVVDGLMAIYPMLDDRTTEAPARLEGRLLWTATDNRAAWSASTPDPTAAYAVPARAADVSGLPPAYLEVGSADLFVDETIEFALRLARVDSQVTLRVVPHAPHAYDLLVPHARRTTFSWAARRRFVIGGS